MSRAVLALIAATLLVAALSATALAGSPPTATTNAPTGYFSLGCSAENPGTATFTGSVNPNGEDTTWSFQYGTTTAYGTATATEDAGSGTADVPVTETVALTSAAAIHFRLVATNADGPVYGADQSAPIVVPPCAPPPGPQLTASADAPSRATAPTCTSTVVLTGTVTPSPVGDPVAATASFAYGPTASYGQMTAGTPVMWSGGGAATTFTANVTSVGPIHFQLVVKQSSGAELATGDAVTVPPPCARAAATKFTALSLRWTFVRFSRTHRTAVVRYQPPCGTNRVHGVAVAQARGYVSLTVRGSLPQPPPECFTRPPARTINVALPRKVTRASRLRHGALTLVHR